MNIDIILFQIDFTLFFISLYLLNEILKIKNYPIYDKWIFRY